MKVTVWNLFVNFRNRTDLSIMPRNSAIQCCIVPQLQLLWEAPAAIVDSFEAATQMKSIGVSAGIHWSARVFNTSFFDGDITFLLSNGLQIRVPNSQFFTPFVGIARNGSRTIDRSKRELLMKGLSDQPATFGRYLFTAAYLMVDHDKKSFSMWQASPSTKTSLVPSSKRWPGIAGVSIDPENLEGLEHQEDREDLEEVLELMTLDVTLSKTQLEQMVIRRQ